MRRTLISTVFVAVALVVSASIAGAQQPTADPKSETVEAIPYGLGPKSPSIDVYYLDGDRSKYLPDEFMSNPSGEVDGTKLKGYHMPALFREAKILGSRKVKPGDVLRFEARAENEVEIQPWYFSYHGPQGRRSTLRTRMRPRPGNPWMHDGTLTVPDWAEPGVYVIYDSELNTELGHSKAYLPPLHQGSVGMEVEVLPHDNVDVMMPELVDVWVGESEANENGKNFDIADLIPIRARVWDNKSGVSVVSLRMSGPDNKYHEIKLQKLFGVEDEFLGYFRINQWSVGGEYIARAMTIRDRAGNHREVFGPRDDNLGALKFNITQDPKNIDETPPRLFSVSLDKSKAKLGEGAKVTVVSIDGHSGVRDVYVDIAASPSFIDKKRVKLTPVPKASRMIKPGYDVEQNTYEGSFSTHELDEPGDWIVTRVMVSDAANNYLDMRYVEYPELEKIKVVFEQTPAGRIRAQRAMARFGSQQ